MVIPPFALFHNLIKKVSFPKHTTPSEIGSLFVLRFNTDIACSLTNCLLATISTRALYENNNESLHPILKSGSEFDDELHDGIESIASKLESEGLEIISSGKQQLS